MSFLGCDGSKTEPAPQPTGAVATQVVAIVTSAALPTGTVAVAAKPAEAKSVPVEKKPKQPQEPEVGGINMNGLRSIEVKVSDTPDLTAFMEYIEIVPNPGPVTIDYYGWSQTVILKADFQPRTTYRVTAKAGLPLADGRVTKQVFRRTFTTGDRPPSVAFAARGRYLPPAGRRAIAIDTVNVTNLACAIRPVPCANIVQLLAREEDRYRRYYGGGGDSEETRDIAGKAVVKKFRLPKRLNEKITTPLDIRDEDGVSANGVYLVSACNGSDDSPSDAVYRLVCLTDIGLSVREVEGCVYVWATSLTRGTPIAGLLVSVYGANNVLVGEGITDADGWCACDVEKDADTFAVVATRKNGGDTSFLSLAKPLDETVAKGARRSYVAKGACEAYVWTDRGIYRHNEKILVHALLRGADGNAPRPFPVTVKLVDPDGKVFARHTQLADKFGAVAWESFSVPDDQMSGVWAVEVVTPGSPGVEIGSRNIKIEEFVPPQIRVKVETSSVISATNATFSVVAEHLFGGPAKGLPVEGAVMFADEPFAPRGWEKYRFGDENRSLQPNFETLNRRTLDAEGRAEFVAALPPRSRPRAAVKMTAQGSVFESGGRPAAGRATCTLHVYPYYVGVMLPDVLRADARPQACRVALVNPDGTPHAGARKLEARFERIEHVYGLKRNDNGFFEWMCDKVRYPLGAPVEVGVTAEGVATLEVPRASCGDFAVTLRDPVTDASFGASYWVGGANDDASVRTSLATPSHVTLVADKPLYHPGDVPRIAVKAPFKGYAWLEVMNREVVYSRVVALTNATAEIALEPVTADMAPGVDVALSVVQAATVGQRHAANRAWGVVPIKVATRDSALDVRVTADVACGDTGGSDLVAHVSARGLDGVRGAYAAVTVVDEGIHILTDEKVPDPVGWFGETRDAFHPLYDLYNYLLPIVDDRLRRSGVKTGGGADDDLFNRISPVPSRRFKPLSRWKMNVPLKDGCADVPFRLPEFVGEVRVTAVAYNARATGAGAVQAKVTPNLVMQADAPRFVAPGDTFNATITLSNRSGKDGTATYELRVDGAAACAPGTKAAGSEQLADGASKTVVVPVVARSVPGEGHLVFTAQGLGEKHTVTIDLPVRPAAAWEKTAETVCLAAGESHTFHNTAAVLPEAARRTFTVASSGLGELAAALEHLSSYPYGCLEQTVSRVFPLIAAGGVLNLLPVEETTAAADSRKAVDAGIRRVLSMVRSNDFTMWPDSSYPPWDRDVSLWAAHFLVEAEAAGFKVPAQPLGRVKGFLRTWAMSTNAATSVYACHCLALAGAPDADRQLHWFDRRAQLSTLDRARLARAFVRGGDRARAMELTSSLPVEDVKTAAFAILALMDLDPQDARLPGLVVYLNNHRGKANAHWGTTAENAHALLALGTWYRSRAAKGDPDVKCVADGRETTLPVKKVHTLCGGGDVVLTNAGKGPAYVTATCLALPDAAAPAYADGIQISRRYFLSDGSAANLDNLSRGDLVIVELVIGDQRNRVYSDLVVEDLLPACFEPSTTPVGAATHPWIDGDKMLAWEMRREMRDDRMLFFSKRFCDSGEKGKVARAYYAVRVVSAGDFIAPGVSVEAMYDPAVRARTAARRIRVER